MAKDRATLQAMRMHLKRPLPKFPISIGQAIPWDEGQARIISARVTQDPQHGFVFEPQGSLKYDLSKDSIHLMTIEDQHLILFNEERETESPPWRKWITATSFDSALLSNAPWGRGKLSFTGWRLPCNRLMEQLSVRAVDVTFEKRTGTTLRAKNIILMPVAVERIGARAHLELAYEWKGPAFGTHELTPLASVKVRYKRAQPFERIQEHEASLRSFLDFVWLGDHLTAEVWLKKGNVATQYSRRFRVQPEADKLHRALRYGQWQDVKQIGRWLVKWFDLPPPVLRALEQIARIYRNPGMPIDIRLVMAIHAVEALHKAVNRRHYRSLHERLAQGLGHLWSHKRDLQGQAIDTYLERIVWTRNEIVHAERHEDWTPTSLLRKTEITKAYYEHLVIVRAMFLETMQASRQNIDDYLDSSFSLLQGTTFRG